MSIIESILGIFTAIGSWFVETVTTMTELFYVAETGLTFLGVLAVCALGVAMILLIVNIIRNYLRFR